MNFEAEAKRIFDDAAKKSNTILEEYTLIYGKQFLILTEMSDLLVFSGR